MNEIVKKSLEGNIRITEWNNDGKTSYTLQHTCYNRDTKKIEVLGSMSFYKLYEMEIILMLIDGFKPEKQKNEHKDYSFSFEDNLFIIKKKYEKDNQTKYLTIKIQDRLDIRCLRRLLDRWIDTCTTPKSPPKKTEKTASKDSGFVDEIYDDQIPF